MYKIFSFTLLTTPRFFFAKVRVVGLDFIATCGEVLFTFFRDSPPWFDADDATGGDHGGVDGALGDDCFAAGGEDGKDVCGGLLFY